MFHVFYRCAAERCFVALRALSSCPFVILLVILLGAAEAVQPKIWREDSQAAFEKGKVEGVSLTREGTVILSSELNRVAETEEAFVWSLAEGPKGELYFGTGNEGRVYRVKPGGAPEMVFDSPGVAIFSLAIASNGTVYAGSSPDGFIYRIAPGKDAELFCRTEDDHVWALVTRPGGGLYAATGGDRGRILVVSAKGEAKKVYESQDPNVVSLALGPDGTLYAGTDVSGLIFRVKEGRADVLYDAKEKEIHTLVVGRGGVLYAGALSASESGKGGKGQGGGQKGEKEASALYAIRPSGSALRVWEAEAATFLGMNVGRAGSLTVMVGGPGRIYRVWQDGTATFLAQMEEIQPWSLAASKKGGFWIGTSGAGAVYGMGEGFAREGVLTSEPYDFTLVSRWGKLAWDADVPSGTSVEFETRSGNSSEPDDTWSDWASLTSAGGRAIASRPARFLQYRVRLKSATGKNTPRLREVTLSGLQENLPPQIARIEVAPEEAGKNGQEPKNGNGVWRISWDAADVNDDRLSYALYFKGRNEADWKLLEEALTSPQFVWHTESVPDGTMQVRVVASDRLSNPEPLALSAEKVSGPFDVDNTAPSVQITAVTQTVGAVLVKGTVIDGIHSVREAAYALNSEKWQVVFPEDEIFDSPTESLKFKILSLKPGEYTLVVRAIDALGNVGVGKTVFTIK